MRRRWYWFLGLTGLVVLACALAKPTPPTTTQPVLAIDGPERVQEGASVTYKLAADVVPDGAVVWVLDGLGILTGDGAYTAPDGILADTPITIRATYTEGGVDKTLARAVTVLNSRRVLVGLRIEGPDVVGENSRTQYRAIATYDDGSERDVTGDTRAPTVGPANLH